MPSSRYEVEANDRPQIKYARTDFKIQFKPKFGEYRLFNQVTKEETIVKELTIIPISDSRFRIKAAENVAGVSIFSSLYKSADQTITVLEKRDGRTKALAVGKWADIKFTPNIKFVKVLYCLVRVNDRWFRAEVELIGIAAIQWQKNVPLRDGILTIGVSTTQSFSADNRSFYEITQGAIEEIDQAADAEAVEFQSDIKVMYASYDAAYDFYTKDPEAPAEGVDEYYPDDSEQPEPDNESEEPIDLSKVPY